MKFLNDGLRVASATGAAVAEAVASQGGGPLRRTSPKRKGVRSHEDGRPVAAEGTPTGRDTDEMLKENSTVTGRGVLGKRKKDKPRGAPAGTIPETPGTRTRSMTPEG